MKKPLWEGLTPKDAFELGVSLGRALGAMDMAEAVAKHMKEVKG